MRASGILMHISSLPSEYGIGSFGKEAYTFIDFLQISGQQFWQVLPLGPAEGNSPYQPVCCFGGNYYFIDPDILAAKGLLTGRELSEAKFESNVVIYKSVIDKFLQIFLYKRIVPHVCVHCWCNDNRFFKGCCN